jgi:hypothetical protein
MRVCCVLLLAGCYAARAPEGAPCQPRDPVCPENQACLLVAGSYICTSGAATDAGADGIPPDGVPPDGAAARWSVVQTTDSTAKTTPLAPTGSGHAIIVAFETPSGNVVNDVTDNAGNTYTRIPASRATVNNSDLGIEIWYATNSKPNATVLNVNANTLYATVIWEVAGLRTANIVDATAVLQNQNATTSPVGPTVTTTQPGDFVIAVAMVANVITNIHAGNPFTNDRTTQDNGWAHLSDPASAAGAYHAQWDQPQSGVYCASTAAFFVAN